MQTLDALFYYELAVVLSTLVCVLVCAWLGWANLTRAKAAERVMVMPSCPRGFWTAAMH